MTQNKNTFMLTVDWRIRRIGQALFTVWAVLTLSFVMVRMMPGNIMGALVTRMSRQGINPARARELIELRLTINPDQPIPAAYVDYLWNTLHGDLGQSVYFTRPVTDIIAETLPWTLFVLSWAIFISFFLGIVFGALMAYWEGGKLDVGLTSYAVVIGSVPFYVLALLLLIFLAYRWGLFPTSGRQPTTIDPGFTVAYVSGIAYHATLPVVSMLVASGMASLGMRGNSIRVLGEDYLRVARLRGLSDLTISAQYVARNAVLPMYTSLLIRIGAMFGGSVVLEQVFQYRGIGLVLLEATHQRDYPLMMGGFMVITVAVVIALLVADLTYGYVDPRARRTQ